MIVYIDYDNKGKIISVYRENQNDKYTKVEINGQSFSNAFNYKYIDGSLVELTPEEKEEFYPLPEKSDEEKQNEQLTEMLKANSTKTYLDALPDEQAKLIPLCYDAWDDFSDGFTFNQGFRMQSAGKLFKAKNEVVKSSTRPENDSENFEDLTGDQQSGEIDDVITLPDNVNTNGFSYVYGKYYKKNGNEKVYQCYRGGVSEEVANSMFGQTQVLYFYPDQLLGAYFREKM